MSCIRSLKKRKAEAKRVYLLEILDRFEEEQETLRRLALVITGDMGSCGKIGQRGTGTGHKSGSPFPFPGQLREWVKRVTIEAAITGSLHEIARCESRYLNQTSRSLRASFERQ